MSHPPALPAGQQPGRVPSLDGLRAISVVMVLLGHGAATIPESQTLVRQVFVACGTSSLGVQIFFVISGYLITYLLKREHARHGRIDLGGFYVRRMARIFPVFFSYLITISVLTMVGFLSVGVADLVTAGSFLWNYGHLWRLPHADEWYLGHFWTLALEEQFYLLWPLTLILAGLRRGAWIAFILIVLMPPLRIASYFIFPDSRGQLGMMLHTGCDALMFGCVLALWQGSPRFERIAVHLGHWLVPVLAALCLYTVLPYATTHIRGFDVVAGRTLNCLAISLIMLWLVRHPDTVVGRLFNARVVVHVGVLSYGLYIWQQLFLTSDPAHQLVPFPFNLLLCFVVAEASYRVIEQPVLAWRRKRDSAAAPSPTAAPAEASTPLSPRPAND